MLNGRQVIDFLAGISEVVMWAGVIVGVISAITACVALALSTSAFAGFAAWSGGLLAASTGIAIGLWAPVLLVAVSGIAAYVIGSALQTGTREAQPSPQAHP